MIPGTSALLDTAHDDLLRQSEAGELDGCYFERAEYFNAHKMLGELIGHFGIDAVSRLIAQFDDLNGAA